VETRALTWQVEAVGTVRPREEVTVAAGVAGVADRVEFREGDEVTPETVLCVVDEKRYQLELDRAAAEEKSAESENQQARVARDQRKPLHEKKIITDEEMADVNAAVERTDAMVGRAKAAKALAAKALEDCRVRPPIAGRINMKGISTGEYVRAETVIATIVDLSELHVRFRLSESDSATLESGREVTFTPRAEAGAGRKATVFWVSQMADDRTRSVECMARLEGGPGRLRPGFSGTVKLELARRDGAVVVPTEAVLPTERGFVVFVLDGKTARERKLKLGITTADDRIEVLSGLDGSETLITRGGASLRDGQDVEVTE
jgi:RND family efflux transporter MFP subunit